MKKLFLKKAVWNFHTAFYHKRLPQYSTQFYYNRSGTISGYHRTVIILSILLTQRLFF